MDLSLSRFLVGMESIGVDCVRVAGAGADDEDEAIVEVVVESG